MSDGITALQRLARLRLENILTAPLTTAISALTSLTSIGLHSHEYYLIEPDGAPLLPAAASVLTVLHELDICMQTTPPLALEAFTGEQSCDQPLMPAHLICLRFASALVQRAMVYNCQRVRFACGNFAGIRDLSLRNADKIKFAKISVMSHLSRCT